MARLNIQDCTSIYSIINNTEETIIEQIQSSKTELRQTNSRNKLRHTNYEPPKKVTQPIAKKFCSYHNVNTHDTSECRAKKKNEKTPKESNNQGSTTFAIRESQIKANSLDTVGHIGGTKVHLTFDTGSAYS